jgi:hypothetical protein
VVGLYSTFTDLRCAGWGKELTCCVQVSYLQRADDGGVGGIAG